MSKKRKSRSTHHKRANTNASTKKAPLCEEVTAQGYVPIAIDDINDESVPDYPFANEESPTECFFESNDVEGEEEKDEVSEKKEKERRPSSTALLIGGFSIAFILIMALGITAIVKNGGKGILSASSVASSIGTTASQVQSEYPETSDSIGAPQSVSVAPQDASSVAETDSEQSDEPQQRPMPEYSQVYETLVYAEEGEQYGTLYAPDAGIDVPLYYGENDSILAADALAQSMRSFQVGYEAPHLLYSRSPAVVSGIYQLQSGNRIAVETSYGDYVFEVTNVGVGTMDADTEQIFDSAGNQLYDPDNFQSILYLSADYPANGGATGQRYVVKAELCR